MNIKEERLKTGLSQQQLADKTGIPKDRIGKWEQGKGKPKAEDSKILIDFFSNYDKEELPQVKDIQTEYAVKSELKDKGQSIERSIEILTEDRSRVYRLLKGLLHCLKGNIQKTWHQRWNLRHQDSRIQKQKFQKNFKRSNDNKKTGQY
jgi:transcriptional regulator with XRE-family HTH domain